VTQLEGLLLESTWTGSSFQIWLAYSRIERSLLKKPQRAVLSADIVIQRCGSRQAASTAFCARR
jgi:hypothetical protein